MSGSDHPCFGGACAFRGGSSVYPAAAMCLLQPSRGAGRGLLPELTTANGLRARCKASQRCSLAWADGAPLPGLASLSGSSQAQCIHRTF